MSTHIAEAELFEPGADSRPPAAAQPFYDDPEMDDGDRLAVARGVATGVIISTPFWILVGFTVYMLL
jgi:hypothetical protein